LWSHRRCGAVSTRLDLPFGGPTVCAPPTDAEVNAGRDPADDTVVIRIAAPRWTGSSTGFAQLVPKNGNATVEGHTSIRPGQVSHAACMG